MIKYVFLLITIFFTSSFLNAGQIYINVGSAHVKKSLLALPALNYYGSFSSGKRAVKTGQEIYKVIKNDLQVSSYFSFVDPAAFLEDTKLTGLKPKPGAPNGFDFNKWKVIETDFLIRIGYKINAGKIEMDAYVYYVPQAKTVFARTYKAELSMTRSLAHRFSNDLVVELTGKKGIFNTKIAFTANLHGKFKEIYVMDWDGHKSSIKRITRSKNLSISPDWSPDGKKLAFTNFAYHPKARTRNADLFLYTFATGKMELVAYKKGTNSGATFHPNGRYVYYTHSRNAVSDINRVDLVSERISSIIKGRKKWTLDLEPHISADGNQIVFSSTRSGRPMIYTMSINGTSLKRRTFAGWYNSSPRFSPDGKKIVFAGQDRGAHKGGFFDIFIMNTDGTNMQRLTSAMKVNSSKNANNEEPSFSPDGQKVIFTSDRTHRKQLYIVDIDGSNERRITFDRYNYEKPRWSPYLEQ